MATLGERFAHAIAQRDRDGMTALLTDDVDFKALTPGRFWDAGSPAEVLDVVFANWFTESDHIDALAEVESGKPVGDTQRTGYRLDITNPDGTHVVEQQVYYRERDGRLLYLRIVCSGYRPA
ncbi:hypothetical protein SAMN05192558_103268 [Actinokineospora alba]|uniref:SnoaL-like domain-containing protein n=1 Tax=Actinokineospora alba TaxID=504798 RepID=A0A1H0JZ66_9PSEU|nr:hypothetical protein [Actinokineospora alba]TDP68112.1 hypothetical protein C8E96_3674 [Actinokineospora alba]SDH92492.1 hypothetical protein SAMN05421871_102781 [Actinokineospora alba]SDO48773.1 hypothetical protein SAMN05192558_103268 [Actinokineospora alba]